MNLEKEVKPILKILSIFLLCTFVSFSASAQEVFSTFIILNGQPIENPAWVEYFSDIEENSLLHTAEVIGSMEEIFSTDVFNKIKDKLDTENRIKFSDLNEIGIKTNMDLNSLNLALTIDVKDKKLSEVNVSNRKKKGEIKNLYKPEPFSGYVNLRSTAEFLGSNANATGQDEFNTSTSTSLEAVLNFKGLVFETQYVNVENEAQGTSENRRSYTRFIIDDQKNAVRYTVGDLTESARGFQEISFGTGFNFRKELTIKPDLFRSSFKKHKFFLETDSKVEIFVNSKLVKKLYLNQGPVELSDFPFISGENEVQIRITDTFGNIRNLNYSDINDSRILPKGFYDYSFSLLFPRRSDDILGVALDDSTYNYSDYNLNGYFHYGAFLDGTIGFDWQYSKNRYLFGLETIYGEDDGLAKLNLAQSRDEELGLDGFAARIEYENLLFKDGKLSDFRLITGFEYTTRGFTTVSSTEEELTEYALSASVGQTFKNSVRGSLGFLKEWGYERGANRNFLTSNFGWSFLKSFDFSANIRFNLDNTDDSTILLSLNWYAPTNDQQSTTTYDPINEVVSSEFVSFPIKNRQNFRTFVGGEANDLSRRAVIGVDYFNQRSELRLAHSSGFSNNDNRTQSTQLGFGTGIAFTQKGFALTRPVENSFVIVSMDERPKGFNVPIGRGVGSQRGEINRFGSASITNIAPYFTDKINLDISQLPYGYNLTKEVFDFYPSYKSGTHIKVAIEGEVSLNGKVVDESGAPASYVTGSVYAIREGQEGANEIITQFFTGGEGGFSAESLEQGDYILVFENDDVQFEPIKVKITKSIGVQELKSVIKLIPASNRR